MFTQSRFIELQATLKILRTCNVHLTQEVQCKTRIIINLMQSRLHVLLTKALCHKQVISTCNVKELYCCMISTGCTARISLLGS